LSASAPAATPAAPHAEPPRAAAGVRAPGVGHTVRVPLRLVVGAQYADAALSVYVKVAALAARREGCTARVAVIAEYLGMSKSAAERGLGQLVRPDIIDGLVEVPTVRRTMSGGTGQSAHRITRELADGELWVRIPVRAAEALSPRLLRLYALLAYATTRRIPVTAAELGEQLFHHTGKRAGEHLGERQARRLVDELAESGWLTVRRREGGQGRHAYETHGHPLRSVPALAAAPMVDEQLPLWGAESPAIHDGSGSDLGDGSLASKEDPQTDRRIKTKVSGGIRRRRPDRKWAATPVDNRVPDTFARGNRVLRTDDDTSSSSPAPGRAPYTGPALQLSPRVWRILEPVRHELPALRAFVLRQVARAIGAQLDTGTAEDRLVDRITRRYARTTTIRDMGRWLLGAALPRHGCGLDSCESGTVWDTGEPCALCLDNGQARRREQRFERLLRELDEREAQLRAERLLEGQPSGAHQEQPPAARPARAESADVRPAEVLGPVLPWPRRADPADRAAATPDDIRTAIAQHGQAAAIHHYGHALVLPHLSALDLPDTGS
jgi:hypothetical protein